jgi:cell wall-associated NlpC family hydrolase
MTRTDVVAEARSWLGTPFKWQASLKGKGCDCKGFPWGVARELGLPEAESLYAAICNYSPRVPVSLLKRGLKATLRQVTDYQDGDLLLVVTARKPQHLGFVDGDRLLHTYTGREVMSSPLLGCLRAWPLDSAWRFPSLEA